MAPTLFAGPRPGVQRRRSIDMAGFGSLLRRGSQRQVEESQDQQQEQQQQQQDQGTNTEQSDRGLGGFFRRATSWRGPSTSNVQSGHSARANSRRRTTDDEKEGPKTEATKPPTASESTKLPPNGQEKSTPVATATAATTKAKPPAQAEESKPGVIRGLLNRAASLTSVKRERYVPPAPPPTAKPSEPTEPDLQPVLVLTEGNHGRVVFQNLEAFDPTFSHSELHASMPDREKGMYVPDASNSRLNNSFHTARTSANSPVDEFFLDFSEREIGDSSAAAASSGEKEGTDPKQTGDPFTGRMKSIFPQQSQPQQKTAGRETIPHTTDDSSGDYSTQDPAVPTGQTQEEAKQQTVSMEAPPETTEEEPENDEAVEEETQSEEQNEVMAALMGVVEEYEMQEKAETCGSTSSGDESEDLDVYDEFPPTFVEDIQVEAQPPREYDELELFYEEQTFAHVGGSYLLGAQSELMTVMEYDEEDYSESDYSEEEGSMDEDEEEDEEEDYYHEDHDRSDSMLMLHSFLPAVQETLEEGYSESYNSSRFGESFSSSLENSN